MLRNAGKLKGSVITATDGAIGEIDDLYFDDEEWTARYLVVKAGTWLSSRKVLISPISIKKVNEPTNQVFVNLTIDQVKHSPDIDTRKPVSRQHETAFMDYYGYPYYWGGPYLWGDSAFPATLAMPPAVESQMAAAATSRQREEARSYDEHLRSVNEVSGYHIEAADGEIGHVDDFILDDEDWAIRFIVIKTGGWLFGRKTLVSPQWIEGISWNESKMFVNLTRDQIANSPEYDESAPISLEYEESLHRHYGRPRRAG
ncbi:MAG: PRC-barrel domain-containing protein [Blastocatellales bacterium]